MQPELIPVEIDQNLVTLDKLLRLELAAAATYESAKNHISDSELLVELELNRVSHATRASTLGKMVRRRGGIPSQNAGPWLALSKLVEAGASLFGDDAICTVLLEGERALMTKINKAYDDLPLEPRDVIQGVMVAEQMRCVERLEATDALARAS